MLKLASFNGGCGGMELHNLGYWKYAPEDAIVELLLDEPMLLTGVYAPAYSPNKFGFEGHYMTLREWINHPLRTLTIATSGDGANGPGLPVLMEKLGFKAMDIAPNPYITHPFQSVLTLWFLPAAKPPVEKAEG